ncbi:MAG: outer membrane protein assembly factor BamE [Marivivens sp.]|nr:outer membrane protein assembly factor BamE [Marivivens sp.]
MSARTRNKRSWLKRIGVTSAVVVGLSACSPMVSNHGYVPLESELSAVVVGRDDRASVEEKLGSPTASGIIGDDAVYYVASRFERVGPFAAEEVDRRVVAVRFNALGVVSNVEEFGLEDGRVVALSQRVTDSGLSDISFIQQLFGNIGNVQPGSLVDG